MTSESDQGGISPSANGGDGNQRSRLSIYIALISAAAVIIAALIKIIPDLRAPKDQGAPVAPLATGVETTAPVTQGPMPTSAPPLIIDTMDSTLGWYTYTEGSGSYIQIASRRGMTGNAIEIVYELREGGWVGMYKIIDPAILSGSEGIRFFYEGSGAPNTIELKILHEPDSRGESAVFSVLWPRATVVDEWTLLEAPYSAFTCWEGTACPSSGELDLDQVWKIDFAISNKPGDTAGIGVVVIDEIEGLGE